MKPDFLRSVPPSSFFTLKVHLYITFDIPINNLILVPHILENFVLTWLYSTFQMVFYRADTEVSWPFKI